jgi:Ser/Thr protein kinase RdoA (MazF antagonist)
LSSFYALSDDDQARRLTDLARAALTQWEGQFDEPQLVKYRENAVFAVQRDDGTRAALRIHRAAYHSDAQLRSELYWMSELARSGIDTPPVIPASNGSLFVHARVPGVPEIRQVDMLGWLSGSPLGASDDSQVSAALYYQLGEFTGRLHSRGAEIRLPADFLRHSWDEEGLLGLEGDPIWGRFWELPALSQDQRALLLTARERAVHDLAVYGKSASSYGMIHADLIRDNVLNDRGRLQAIDFDDCGFGWYVFELATMLYAILDKPHYTPMREQLFAGYCAVRPLSAADIDRLPLFMFLRASTYLGWLQTRSETQTAREMGPVHIERCCRVASDYLDARKAKP